MKFGEIYNTLFSEGYNSQFEYIERDIKAMLRKENDIVIKQELILFLLICLIKKNIIETFEMSELFYEFVSLSENVEKLLISNYKKSKTNHTRIYLDVFYRTNIHRLYVLERLYSQLNLNRRASVIKVLRNDFRKNESFINQDWGQYFGLFLNKILSNYGTSFWYLFGVIIVSVFVFGLVYFFIDALSGEYFVGSNGYLESFDYYLYVSLATFSNLGADTSMAGNVLLRIMFGIEQIVGLVAFGIFVTLVGKKFND